MKFEVHVTGASGKRTRIVEFAADGVRLDGQLVEADVQQLTPNTISVLLHGKAFEIHVSSTLDHKLKLQNGPDEFTAEVRDPRVWHGRTHGAPEVAGRQQITAPMPGKIMRLLVAVGDCVVAGQGLMIVEAMKMQNEIRSPKSGKVERLLATESQIVNAGEVLAWIE